MPQLSSRRASALGLLVAASLAASACAQGGGSDAPSATPSTSTPASTSVSSGSATTSAPNSTTPASTGSAPAAACSGTDAEEAWAEVYRSGGTDSPDPTVEHSGLEELLVQMVDTDGYDDCAALSWIAAPMSGHALAEVELHLFHRGEYIGKATEQDHSAVEVVRVSDDTLRATYHWTKPGESTAGASGKAVSEFTWDPQSETVVRTGELPPAG